MRLPVGVRRRLYADPKPDKSVSVNDVVSCGTGHDEENSVMKIETERLIIRSIQTGDETALADMAKDGSLSELGFDENCSQWISDWINEAIDLSVKDDPRVDYICGIICLKDDQKVIGSVGNTYYEDTDRIGICYGIGAKYRQSGYASEAVKAYLEYFFDHYGEDEIIAAISDDNTASRKTAEKAGFQLLDVRMYKDIYDTEERLYRFYAAKRAIGDRA